MPNVAHNFGLVLFNDEGERVGTAALNVDWEPAVECARFYSLRRGELPWADVGGAISILPLWDHSAGEPCCRGFRVAIARADQSPCVSDFRNEYFRRLAAQAAGRFVESGLLAKGEVFRYVVVALEVENDPAAAESSGLAVAERTPTLDLLESSLSAWQSQAKGVGFVDTDDMPLFCPQSVLDQVAEQTLAHRGKETGGVLIGRLHRDQSLPEIFAEVTAQIPAEHTRGDAVKLTFTAETWVAVNAAIKLRNRSEIYLGYWHSHPVFEWCKSRGCSLEKQSVCKLAKDFFSADDEALLRAVFPRGHSVALVANDTAFQGLSFSWFGWREGAVHPRGFYLKADNHAA